MNITNQIIPGLPKNPYRNGFGNYEGVVAHSTATPEAPAVNIRNFESRNWNSAFVHFAVDWNGIIQIADTNFICWGAGHNANQRFVQVELCETANQTNFQKSYSNYVWLLAKLLNDKGLNSSILFTHQEISKMFPGDTNHQDPVQYLSGHGVSIAKLKADVQNQINSMRTPAPAPSGKVMMVVIDYAGSDGLAYHKTPDFNNSSVVGVAHHGDAFTVIDTVTVGSSKMYKLKSGFYITASSKYVHVIYK